jgi:pimeloyl-ACP methyl ester carboxylesterase
MYFKKLGSGPPVVLIHGLGAYSFSWEGTAEALKGSHTTYAVDLIGSGQSPAPAGFPSTMAAQADAVSKLIRDEKLSNPVVIGHSMGGGVALRVAEQAGKGGQPNLRKLVLVAPVAYPPSKSPEGAQKLGMLLKSSKFDPSIVSGPLVAEILRSAYHKPERITPQQIAGYAKGLSSRAQMQAFVEHSASLGEFVPEDRLKTIDVETLIIWGEDDTFLDPSHGVALEKAINSGKTSGNASLETIPDCGHIPQEEKPAETNKLITDFLAK